MSAHRPTRIARRHRRTPRTAVRCVAIAVSLLLVVPGVARPQSRADSAARASRASDSLRPPRDTVSGAPVVFEGDTLFRLYGSLGPFSARERAAALQRQLLVEAARGPEPRDSVRVTERDGYSELTYRGRPLMTVVDVDAAAVGGGRAEVAGRYAAVVQRALTRAYETRDVRSLLWHGLLALIETIALALVLRAMAKLLPRLYRRINALRGREALSLRIQRFELVSAGRVADALVIGARLLRVVVTILLAYAYLTSVLGLFPWTAPFADRVVAGTLAPVLGAARAIASYLPNLLYIVVIILVTRYVLKFSHFVFRAVASGAITIEGFYADWAEPTYKIFRALVLAFALVVLWPYLPGSSSTAFKGISIFAGVLLSLGSSSAVANVVAGVVLTYTRAFQLGDRVRIGDTVGDVVEKTLLVTRVHTVKNEQVTIPNGMVLSGHVVNYSALCRDGGLILHTTVTIGYDAPWRTVHELLVSAARATPGILAEPAPFVLQRSLDDFFVSYEINAYTDDASRMLQTYGELHAHIQDAFNAAGVEIMSPHYTAFRDGNPSTIPSADGARPAPGAPGRRGAPPAATT